MTEKRSANVFIIFFVITFVVANSYFFISILGKASNNIAITQTYQINEYQSPDSLPVTKFLNTNVLALNNFTQLESQFQIYALGGTEYTLNNDVLKLTKGTLMLSAENFRLSLNNETVTISNKFKLILDEEDGAILIDGDAALNNKILELNSQLLFVSSDIEVYEFDRSQITNEDKYTKLKIFLEKLNILPEYFKDNIAPELVSISPRDEFITVESFVRLFGYTEPRINVEVNGDTIKTDEEGYFTKQVNLKSGNNPVTILLKDKYGNDILKSINYVKSSSDSAVSFPISFPN